jgi:hypothetical protein
MELNIELIKLQDELSKLESAVSHINKAEKISSTVIESAKQVQNNFADKLNEVISYYHLYLDKLKNSTEDNVTELSKTLLKLADEINLITRDYTKLSESTLILSEKIESINFPLHLNHLEIKTDEIKSMLADTVLTQEAANSDLKHNVNKELDNFLAKQYELSTEVQKLSSSFTKNTTKISKEITETNTLINTKSADYEEIKNLILKQSEQIHLIKIFSITTFVLLVIFFVLLMIK